MGKVAGIAQQALGVFSGQMMTRAVDSLVNLGKTALSSVGALEQNVGGVETLFGDTADAVIAAADRAYQTAGMSANDYMSTVTSFSASLLQSLGGNTEEAAKVADMAIIDMADNANKMGTSMDMIQNAYQGFAKQNYTMLDNLKLGYGGTKTEMERLLADAQKLTGVKYDINNLNDVYQAIHVIQEEMGITGTTAKEASETLEGSMAAAKAAWDNFMNGSGDADQLADAFATAADNIVKNLAEIIPRFAETLPALAGAIVSQIPGLAAAIVPAALSAGQSILEQARDAVTAFDFVAAAEDIVQKITDFISSDGLGSFLGCLVDIFTGIVNGISSMLPVLLPALVELIAYTVTTLIDQLPALLECALQLIIGLADGLLAALPVLIAALPEIINSVVSFLVAAVPQILQAGITLLLALIEAIPVIVPQIVAALPQIITAIINGLIAAGPQVLASAQEVWGQITAAVPQLIADIGAAVPEIINGIVNGLAAGASAVWDAACQLGSNILGGIKSFLGINSPSTVMAEQGNYIIQGLLNGLETMPDAVNQLFQSTLDSITTWGSNMVARIGEWGANMATTAGTAMNTMVQTVIQWVQQLPEQVWVWLVNTANKLNQWTIQLVQKGQAAATGLVNAVLDGVRTLPGLMVSVGSDIVQGLWNGISAGWSWLTNKVADLAQSLLQAAKNALDIGSPSREFRDEVGRWIMPGIGEGIDRSMPETLQNLKARAGELVGAMRAELAASTSQMALGASHAAGLRAAGVGTTVYYDNRVEQNNEYHVPVASPSEVNKAQREAVRKLVGGVK
jgi:phage-related protein